MNAPAAQTPIRENGDNNAKRGEKQPSVPKRQTPETKIAPKRQKDEREPAANDSGYSGSGTQLQDAGTEPGLEYEEQPPHHADAFVVKK